MKDARNNAVKVLEERIEFYDEAIEKLNDAYKILDKIDAVDVNETSGKLALIKAKTRYEKILEKTSIGKLQNEKATKNGKTYVEIKKVNMKILREDLDEIYNIIVEFTQKDKQRYFNKMFAAFEIKYLINYFTKLKKDDKEILEKNFKQVDEQERE